MRLFFAALACAAALRCGATQSLEILFADEARGFGVTGIVNLIAGESRFVASDGRAPDFWQLSFERSGCGTTNKVVWLDNRAPVRQRTRKNDGAAEIFIWRGLDLPGEPGVVDVRADVTRKGARAEWRLFVRNRSTTWGLSKTRYPCFRDVLASEGGDALVPTKHLGARFIRAFDQKKLSPREYGYPGWYPMITAFQHGDAGLYVAAEDPDSRIKTLRYERNGSVYFETPVENAGCAKKAAEGPRFTVVTEAYRGDWWQAARIYRAWALKQKWCAKGPIWKRADYPKAMSDVAIWARQTGEGIRATNFAERVLAKWPDVKIGFRWYCWHKEPFDSSYPIFTPHEDVKGALAIAREKGFLSMPYVNGRLWSVNLPSYAAAEPFVCRRATGEAVTEKYRANEFGVMCPATAFWQDKLNEIGNGVVSGLGANSIYYDQITCSRPQLCHDPRHGHPLGGGSWWADGYHAALSRIHAEFSERGIPVTSEGAAETWLDVVDGHLIVGRNATTEDVPFLPAVYSGYTTYFCSEEQATDKPDAFFARQATAVLQGCVSGSWSHGRLFDNPPYKSSLVKQADILLRLARLRRDYAEFLAYGTLVDELRTTEPFAHVAYSYESTRRDRDPSKTTIEYPAVVGYVWRNADGTQTRLFAANVTAERQVVMRTDRAPLVLDPFDIRVVE